VILNLTGVARVRYASVATLAALVLGAPGCGGGQSSVAPFVAPAPAGSTVHPAGTSQAVLTFTFPDRRTSASRTRAYISPNIASLSVAVNGAAATFVNAPPIGAGRTVTVTIPAPVGNDTFAFAEYDMNDGKGNLLGRTSQPMTIQAGIVNNLAFTLDGQLAKIAFAPAGTSPFLEVGGTAAAPVYTLVGNLAVPFNVLPEDADGNVIVTPGAVPAVTVAGPSGSPIGSVPGANGTIGLFASAPTAPVAVTATGKDLDGKTITASLMIGASAAIYIANYLSQTITAYDESGTALALPSTSFNGLTNPMGLAYVPSATPGTSGSLVITETANSSAPFVMEYDQSGGVQVVQNSAFTNTMQPLFPSYAPAAGTSPATLSLPNYKNSTVTQYDAAGNALPIASGKFAGLASPVQIVYDSNNAHYYVTNLGSFNINQYTTDGTTVGTPVSAGNHPMGVAYDGNNKHLYVAFSGQVATVSSSPPSPSGIMEFDENLATISTTGQFTNANPNTASYIGILFDPFNKQLYVTDAGDNAVVAFTEAGAAVTLPTGAFAKLNDPMSLAIVP